MKTCWGPVEETLKIFNNNDWILGIQRNIKIGKASYEEIQLQEILFIGEKF